jgi:hypothetical protein
VNIPGYDAWRLSGPDDDRCPECGGHGKTDCGGDGDECGPDCPACEGEGTIECSVCSEEPDGDYLYELKRDRGIE